MKTAPWGPISSLVFGFKIPFQAAKIIFKKADLLLLSALPVAITTFLYYQLIRSSQTKAKAWLLVWLESFGVEPTGWIAMTVVALTSIALILVGVLTFSFISGMIASPFNDFLAERTEKHSPYSLTPSKEYSFFSRTQLRLIWIDLVKTMAATLMGIIALLLSWVPVINLVATAIFFLLISFQFLSYPQTRRGQSLSTGAFFVLKRFFPCLGFGACITLLFSIPFLSPLALPLAVVGGTLLYAAYEN